jgi:hypothetical protein
VDWNEFLYYDIISYFKGHFSLKVFWGMKKLDGGLSDYLHMLLPYYALLLCLGIT